MAGEPSTPPSTPPPANKPLPPNPVKEKRDETARESGHNVRKNMPNGDPPIPFSLGDG